jgi:hypothetical protein
MAVYTVANKRIFFLGVQLKDLQPGTPFSIESEQHTNVQHSADGAFSVSSTDPAKAVQGTIRLAIMGMSPQLNALIQLSEARLAAGLPLVGELMIADDNNGVDIHMPEATLVNRPAHRSATNQIEPTELTIVGRFYQVVRTPVANDGGFKVSN